MVTRESGYNPGQMPVQEMWDMLIHSTSALDRPGEAHAFTGLQAMEIASGYVEGKPVTEGSLEEMKNWLALENHIGSGLVDFGKINPARLERRGDYYEAVQAKCAEKGIEVDFAGVVEAAQAVSASEAWDYFMGEFTDYYAYLSGEKPLPIDEQTGEPIRLQDPSHYIGMAEALWIGALFGDFGAENIKARAVGLVQKVEKLERQLAQTTTLLFEANKVGLGIKFGSLISDPRLATPFVEALVTKLKQVRASEGDDSYRHVYNFATGTLREAQRSHLLTLLPKETTPLLLGSTHEILHADSDHSILAERFEEGELVWTSLSDGSRIAMPYINYRHRTILGYGTNRENEIYESQSGVDFDTLPEDAKAAVEKAIEVEDQELSKSEKLPYYKRLAFWHDEERRDLLYTVVFRDGAGRIMTRYPDHHGFVTSDKERKLDYPVKSVQPVKDTYMVMTYDGSYMWDQTFSDTDPNFFGPGEDQANAFWIMGNARTVHSKTDPRLSTETEYGSQAKFVIVPVRYYKIEEDKEAPDPTSGNEEADFLASIQQG